MPELVDSPAALEVTARCEMLAADEGVLGSSSEGDLWLSTNTSLRVVRPDGDSTQLSAAFENVAALRPWGEADATVVDSAAMWRLRQTDKEYVFIPEELRDVRHFCGDPERDGWVALITRSGLYDREGGQWFSIGPSEGMNFASIEWLANVDGACQTPGGGLWFGDGASIWRVDEATVRTFDVPDAVGPALISEGFGVVVATPTRLLFAPEAGPVDDDSWAEVEFSAGDIGRVGAGGDALWVSAGEQLFRYDGEWRQAAVELVELPSAIHGDARGGAWLELSGQVCYVGEHDVALRGLRPYEILPAGTLDLQVETEATRVEIRRDGGAPIAAAPEGDRFVADYDVGQPGWHVVEVLVDGTALRRVPYRVLATGLSWDADVRPIYEAHCANSMCHGADTDTTIPLNTAGAWVDSARAIRARISDGTMPRGAGDEWTTEMATRVIDWTESPIP